MSTLQIPITAFCLVDSKNPDDVGAGGSLVGQFYLSGTKTWNWRSFFKVDVATPLVGWTDLTAARLVGTVGEVTNAAFAATLRQVTEEFTYTEATYNSRITGTAWATAGADTPNSATDTNKIGFTSPAANGLQTIVSGLLTLVNLVLGGDGILRFHIRSDDESPGASHYFGLGSPYLEVDGTAPAGGAGWAHAQLL